jgi:hypothetical protein
MMNGAVAIAGWRGQGSRVLIGKLLTAGYPADLATDDKPTDWGTNEDWSAEQAPIAVSATQTAFA